MSYFEIFFFSTRRKTLYTVALIIIFLLMETNVKSLRTLVLIEYELSVALFKLASFYLFAKHYTFV